ncbi:5'-methylthioadenosine/adenosylhomocysteine nucleosidase [Brevibacillus parabrevis]|uniref:5'-methylthioadenosine/adenosylhomocysteine nucleosidase n=1 Tax=Brevibacillus parabrevis TaxID=54914 RepID=UPI0011360CD9|nr:5'-methylthioadenosine/adenosylhomocysteine nucleosidase [Brevibacillus parabrevis]MED1723665.1 5'-methylthioadenosine/adenosylhomocysteine nucleosidase [Brevibacillus parabrevis]TGV30011.1 5'-methylthioadenosine/adenosylhomocysteine nucleosidase [Mesorhizobium sp. M00.F.Ca.ET.186.01.1.1]
MRYGIIGAMDEEIALYLEAMQQATTTVKAGVTYYSGKMEGKEVVLCKSGVGKVNAAVTTQILLDQFQVERVIFTGVAGAVHPELNIGDIVVSTDCLQHDIDVTPLGFAPGQIPFTEQWTWQADQELMQQAIEAGKGLEAGVQVVSGRILSGDQFVASREKVQWLYEQFQAHCTEMEGAAVGQVCAMNGVPFVVVRSMSDKADGSAHVNFVEFTKLASQRSYAIVRNMLLSDAGSSEPGVIVYSTKNCVDCDMVKQWLTAKGISFEVRDVMTSRAYQEDVERFGFMGVPVTVVGDKAVKGFAPAELEELVKQS